MRMVGVYFAFVAELMWRVCVCVDPALNVLVRNGGSDTDVQNPNSWADCQDLTTDGTTGRHESRCWYQECKQRERNQGLLALDQKLKGNSAIYTRQNPNGNRNGLECPEERDYYPYWAPSPWNDVAYLTDHVDQICPLVAAANGNSNPVYKCWGPQENDQTVPITVRTAILLVCVCLL